VHGRRAGVLLLLLPVVTALSACTSGGDGAAAPAADSRPAVPDAYLHGPSPVTKQICTARARRQVARSIGVAPIRFTAPTWADHRYSCSYIFPEGPMTLSVTEYPSEVATAAAFFELKGALGRRPEPPLLGEEAFVSTNGDVIAVRVGTKLLEVDLSQLPAQLGVPLEPRLLVARAVAGTIIGCDDPPCPKGALRFPDEDD
jgi:hypothetical protein